MFEEFKQLYEDLIKQSILEEIIEIVITLKPKTDLTDNNILIFAAENSKNSFTRNYFGHLKKPNDQLPQNIQFY